MTGSFEFNLFCEAFHSADYFSDQCFRMLASEPLETPEAAVKDASDSAHMLGWRRTKTGYICPACAQNPQQPQPSPDSVESRARQGVSEGEASFMEAR